MELVTCKSCPLWENALTNCMQGVDRGKTMIVLPGPSGEDDVAGEVGEESKFGRLLTAVCREAGLRREDISIAFATRCKASRSLPVGSREIEACRDHLKRQIHRVQPTIIISLGDVSLRSLCKTQGIKSKRGTELPLHPEFAYQCPVFPTYGLDELVRVPTYRRTIVSDIRRARDTGPVSSGSSGSSGSSSVPIYELFDESCSLPESPVYAWDGEWATGGKIVDYFTMLSCSDGDRTFVTRTEYGIRSMLMRLQTLSAKGTTLVTHNGWGADLKIARNWDIEMPYGIDTMAMAYLDDETQALSLQSIAVKYLGVRGWKHDDWETFDPSSKDAAEYAARDAQYTFRLYTELLNVLGPRMRTVTDILRPAREALDKQTERGIWIDPRPLARERMESEEIRRDSMHKLRQFAGEKFNPGSSKQVGEYLTRSGFVLPKTVTDKPATGLAVLQTIKSPFCDELLRYRSATKTLNTYVAPYERITQTGDGRVHPTYTLFSTLTGRSSARNLNIQNLDRDLKDFFFAPPGHTFVSVDFGAIEFRIAAWFAREQVILQQYAADPNWDPHRFVASLFFNKPADQITKAERQIAKSANFGLLYLASTEGLFNYAKKSSVSMSPEMAHEMRSFWHETFPGFRRFYHQVKEELKKTSQVVGPTGHIRHFGDYSLLDYAMRSEALRQGVNCKVQNFSAHLAYIAMAELERQNLPCIGFIHDAFLFDFTTRGQFDRSRELIEHILTKYPVPFLKENFDVDLDVPLAVEFEVRDNDG